MAKYETKTKENSNSVEDFINAVPDQRKRNDALTVMEMMKVHSGFEPKMWGPSIIGFGSQHYKYESGHEGDQPLIGFSPRKAELVLYLASNFENREALLSELGKHKTSVACLYIKRLDDINLDVLEKMIINSLKISTNGC